MTASTFTCILLASLLLLFSKPLSSLSDPSQDSQIGLPEANFRIHEFDADLLEFSLNLEYLETEFFLGAATGHGLDQAAPNLTMGGPSPKGVRRANLDPLMRDIITQFAYQEVGHISAIRKRGCGFPRPLMDLSSSCFAKLMNKAFNRPLEPPFDPYANNINFLLTSYLIPYIGLTGYVGMCPLLQGHLSRKLCGGLLGVQSAQDAIIRSMLYERGMMKVEPYGITVAEFTNRISEMRNKLGGSGVKDEGIIIPPVMGAEGKPPGRMLAGDRYSVAFHMSPREILRIMYGKGTARIPGGFFPSGANGRIARSYLHSA